MWNAVNKPLGGLIFILGFAIPLLFACTTTPEVVKVGLVAPFEGAERELGYDSIYAARLAVREFNESGGTGRTRVALVALDNSAQADLNARIAAGLVLDQQLVAVITIMPSPDNSPPDIYAESGVAVIPLNRSPFEPFPPREIPAEFRDNYAAVTPFDEVAGPLAAPTYDAMGLIFAAIHAAEAETGKISRNTVQNSLQNLTVTGITGEVYINE